MPAKSKSLTITPGQKLVLNDSLLATETEKHATSKSLYGDNKARISSNVGAIHDRMRISAYSNIMQSLKGKSVLHLGCGMGLISMIAARALASHVVAVDTSAIVDAATVVAKENKLDNITFLRGKIQDVVGSLPVKKFDIVLCEWMGSFVTNDEMLEELIYCRDNLLAAGGLICPDKSNLHVVGISDYNYYFDSVEYWDNVYGFTMKPMKKLVLEEVSTCHIPRKCIATNSCLVHTVDVSKLDMEKDRAFTTKFSIQASTKTTIHFLTFYVDATFENPQDTGANFVLGFNPGGANAWTEVSVPLATHIPVNPKDVITGEVKVTPTAKHTVVEVSAECKGSVSHVETSGKYVYTF